MSEFSASEALSFSDTFFPFFLGELFDVDGVNIHSIWIDFGVLVTRGMISLDGVGVIGFFMGNGLSSFPLSFKVNCMGVPIINLSWGDVHGIDLFHERNRGSSRKEIDEGIFMGDFTKGNIVFELGNVISKWKTF